MDFTNKTAISTGAASGMGLLFAQNFARLGGNVVMCDVNGRAVQLSNKNIRANGLSNAQAVVSDAFSALEGGFDHVVTNPPIRAGKQVIYAMFDEACRRLSPGGTLTIVIRKQQGAPSAKNHLTELFGNAEVIARGGGYWIIRSVKEA